MMAKAQFQRYVERRLALAEMLERARTERNAYLYYRIWTFCDADVQVEELYRVFRLR